MMLATTSEAALEMMAAHFCRTRLTPETPAAPRMEPMTMLNPRAMGMDKMLRKKLP